MALSLRLAAVIAAVTLTPAPAWAYVRMRTPDGVALEWRRGCPRFTIEAHGGAGLSARELMDVLEGARTAWASPTAACTQLPIEVVGADGDGDVDYDGTSLVLWRDPKFCKDRRHADDEVCLSPNAVAVTTLFYYETGDRAGEILEADVELNGRFRFARDGDPTAIDLDAALTHELGHALGLEHNCDTVPGRAPLYDDTGARVPPCFPLATVPAALRQETMFPYLVPGDLQARTPVAGELGSVCQVYGTHDASCEYTGPGCGCDGGPAGTAPGAGLIVAAAWAWRRRRAARE